MSQEIKVISEGGMEIITDRKAISKVPYFNEKPTETTYTINDINSDVMDLVIKYLEHYKEEAQFPKIPDSLTNNELKDQINDFDFNLVDKIDFETVFKLINAASLLQIDSLHDLGCAKIAAFMKDKPVEEVSKHFTFECQLTTEEAKELGLEVEETA